MSNAAASQSPPPDAAGPVLVVEDDPDIRGLLTRRLARHHLEPLEAASGEEALALARDRRPSLVLLDIRLPGVDGWEVIEQLRADPDLSDVPVVVVSIVDDPGVGQRPAVAGYLTKPFLASDVDRILRDVLPGSGAPPHQRASDHPGGGP